jgi:hypothetical protein
MGTGVSKVFCSDTNGVGSGMLVVGGTELVKIELQIVCRIVGMSIGLMDRIGSL